MLLTCTDFAKKTQNERIFSKKKKIPNTFFKMRLVSTIVNLMIFEINTSEKVLYYGENGSSRFLNRLESSKKRVFLTLF